MANGSGCFSSSTRLGDRLGHKVALGNPARMQQYSGLKSTDDRSDARWLAEMVRLGIFPETHICPRQIRAVRDALRGLQQRWERDALRLERLRAEVKAGIDAIARGEFVTVEPGKIGDAIAALAPKRRR